MAPFQDYIYQFPRASFRVSGRCRVRLYQPKQRRCTVVLTELRSNRGEALATACDRIATDLVARWNLNPKTTDWIEHNPAGDHSLADFFRVVFTWNDDNVASKPTWHALNGEQVETLTGASLTSLNQRLGSIGH